MIQNPAKSPVAWTCPPAGREWSSVISVVQRDPEVSQARLLAKGRPHNHVRDLALYLACRHFGRGLTEIADYFGGRAPR